MRKYIHFNDSTLINAFVITVDTQPFASKGIL